MLSKPSLSIQIVRMVSRGLPFTSAVPRVLITRRDSLHDTVEKIGSSGGLMLRLSDPSRLYTARTGAARPGTVMTSSSVFGLWDAVNFSPSSPDTVMTVVLFLVSELRSFASTHSPEKLGLAWAAS